jgi:Protein of unknown function (DUF2786)
MQPDQIDKIKKLLAVANDPATTEEAQQTYMDKATSLMAKWGIDQAVLSATDEAARIADEIVMVVFDVKAPAAKTYSREWARIGVGVAGAFGLMGIFAVRGQGMYGVTMIGYASDVSRAEMLWRSLELQASWSLATWVRTENGFKGLTPMERYKARRGFIVGFARRTEARLKDLHQKVVAEEGGPGTEIVLRDRRRRVEDWANLNLKTSKMRPTKHSVNGLEAGAAAGDQAHIGQVTVSTVGPRELEA